MIDMRGLFFFIAIFIINISVNSQSIIDSASKKACDCITNTLLNIDYKVDTALLKKICTDNSMFELQVPFARNGINVNSFSKNSKLYNKIYSSLDSICISLHNSHNNSATKEKVKDGDALHHLVFFYNSKFFTGIPTFLKKINETKAYLTIKNNNGKSMTFLEDIYATENELYKLIKSKSTIYIAYRTYISTYTNKQENIVNSFSIKKITAESVVH